MVLSILQPAVLWVIKNGYLLMFVLMLIEGPVITAAGAFAAALGFFSVWVVFVLSILGNIIPDIIYYFLGYWGRERFVDKYGRYFGLSKKNIDYVESLMKKHSVKTLVLIKTFPLMATPGLIAVGIMRMDLKKYIKWCTIITIPSSLLYLVIGYYFGTAYHYMVRYIQIGEYLFLFFVLVFIFAKYFAKKILEGFYEKWTKD